MDIGEKIKNHRLRLGLTQEELGERADLTKGFISQLEHDQTSPSIDTLENILNALGLGFVDFFQEAEEQSLVFYEKNAIVSISKEDQHKLHWIVPRAQTKRMEPVIIEISDQGKSRTYDPFEGEVFGYVLEGSAYLHYDKQEYKLEKTDCFYFEALGSFWLENQNKRTCKILWLVSPPVF